MAAGDTVALDLPLAAAPRLANPQVRQDAGRVAVLRGPLVYCAEEADNGPGLNAHRPRRRRPPAADRRPPSLAGAVAARPAGRAASVPTGATTLYRTAPPRTEPGTARLVPYHLWDNRAPGEMLVWFRTT